MNFQKAYSYDDILLCPSHSFLDSRSNVDLNISLDKNINLELPLISAPMDTVTEKDMAIIIGKKGGLGIIHRYLSVEDQVSQVRAVKKHNVYVGAAIGISGDYITRFKKLIKAGADVICVDVAFGFNENVRSAILKLKEINTSIHIMGGNVGTYSGFVFLAKECAVDSVRVGIGGGAACTTSLNTGFGVPSVTAICEAYRAKKDYGLDTKIIADGGIKNTGDMVKSLAVGADFFMLGKLLSIYKEAPLEGIFRGMASKEAREAKGDINIKHKEGVSFKVPIKDVSVSSYLKDVFYNLKSGLSYNGSFNLQSFKKSVNIYTITNKGLSERQVNSF